MIFDYENMFLHKKAASTYGTTAAYSDVVVNGEGEEETCAKVEEFFKANL